MRGVFHFDEKRFRADSDETDDPGEDSPIVAPAERPTLAETLKRDKFQTRAERELRWFFRDMGGRVRESGAAPECDRVAAQAIDGWLRSIPPFHRGALSLSYEKRPWPKALTEEFGSLTSLVVRIESAHLTDGTSPPEAVEKAAVRYLEEAVEACRNRRTLARGDWKNDRVLTVRQRTLTRRRLHAQWHVTVAVQAYLGARGEAPSVLPNDPSNDAEGT